MTSVAGWTLLGPRAPAIAEPGALAPQGLYAEWDLSHEPPLILVEGESHAPVTLMFHAMLGNLDTRWEDAQHVLDERGLAEIQLELPADAWLDDAAEDYVTDLRVKVRTPDQRVRLPLVHVAWEGGRTAEPTLWDGQQMRDEAPNGVLDVALREGLESHVRVLPNVGPNSSNLDPTEAR